MSLYFGDKLVSGITLGIPGKSAYNAAQEGGYTGTEEEFNELLANIDNVEGSIPITSTPADDVDVWIDPDGSGSGEYFYNKAEIDGLLTGKAPATHAAQHKTGGSDALTAADIGAAPSGYGLGEPIVLRGETEEELQSAVDAFIKEHPTTGKTYFCSWGFGNILVYGTLTVCNFDGCYLEGCAYNHTYAFRRKVKQLGVWQPIEFVNPPMDFNTEVRTAERHNGKPVYRCAVNIGQMLTKDQNKYAALGVLHDTLENVVDFSIEVTMGSFKFVCPHGKTVDHGELFDAFVWTNGAQWFINISHLADLSAATGIAIVKYTKTTD